MAVIFSVYRAHILTTLHGKSCIRNNTAGPPPFSQEEIAEMTQAVANLIGDDVKALQERLSLLNLGQTLYQQVGRRRVDGF